MFNSASGVPTTLNIQNGAVFQQHLFVQDTSLVTMSGGIIQGDLHPGDPFLSSPSESPQVHLSGGTVGNNFYAYNHGTATVSGASVGGWLGAFDNSHITFSAGTVALLAVASGST